MSNNSLLLSSELPTFSLINPQYIKKSIQEVLMRCYDTVDELVSKKNMTWDTLYYPLMIAENELQRTWSPIKHLNSVRHNLEFRKAYEESLLFISEYRNWVNQHYGLYNSYKLLCSSDHYQQLNAIQKKVLNNVLINFELSGVCLSAQRKKKYAYISSRLLQLSSNYANNVFDATCSWSKLITEKQMLSGIPDAKLEIARLAAQTHGLRGWLFTLQYPSYSSVLVYCDNQELREELYWAFNTRASDQGPNGGKWDNTLIMDEILSLRYELAQILGFNTYLEKSLSKKMIRKPRQIFDFLINLSTQICRHEYTKFLEIQDFARKQYSCTSVKPWDMAYYREKQKQHIFSITNEELRYYFPEKVVLYGMFKVVNIIYGITVQERFNIETWHTDVRFFDIFDEEGEWRGGFYLDIYIRDNKCEGAWMDELVSMMYRSNSVSQRPIAYLTCNFERLEYDNTSCLLTHDDVITLFHEFGHVLHHVMTHIDIPEISGINGFPWDAIELPSQLMEKFCWEPAVLRLISMHYKTEQPLPSNIMNNLLKIKTYQSSFNILRQIIYGLFDLRIHYDYVPGLQGQILKILNEVVKKVSIHNSTMMWSFFPHSFLHIFSNDYAAGYYSYLWADMLASNVWDRFQEAGLFNLEVGKYFLNNILSLEGVIDLEKCLTQFCGRSITVESMLRYYDIPAISISVKDSILE